MPPNRTRSPRAARVIGALRAVTVRHVTAGSFTIVAAVAAAISYSHVRDVAGGGWQAMILPLSVDGLLVAGSLALWMERRDGARGSALSWISVVLGLIASLCANLAAGDPTLIPQAVLDPAVAAWPALALALAFELLVRVARAAGHAAVPEAAAEAGRPPVVPDAPDASTSAGSTCPSPSPQISAAESASGQDPAAQAMAYGDAVAWAVREGAGAKRIQAHTGLSEHHAKRAAAEAKAARGPRAVAG